MRRIGILMTIAANDPKAQARIAVFARSMQALGWTDGRNVRIDTRWSTAGVDTRKYAAELAALPSDVVLANGTEAVGFLQAATRTIPIVFVLVPDPIGQGFVDSLARPRGNVTGFTLYEFGMGGKSNSANAVVFPPGRAKLETKPELTGSMTVTKTIGIVRVACCTAVTPGVVAAKMTSGPNA
jgi:hypothetical protein